MARLIGPGLREILQLQWIAYWRRFARGGSGAKNNLIVLGLIAVGMTAKYVSILKGVVAQTRKGQFFELDLLAAAVFLLCVSPVWDTGSRGMGPRDLARFPLTMRERLFARIWGGLVSPISWVAALYCFTIFWPLAVSPHPLCATVAGLAFLRACFMSGFSARHFQATAVGRKFAPLIVAILLIPASITVFEVGLGMAPLNMLPSHLLILAAQGSWLSCSVLIVLAIVATLLARYSLTWMLEHAPATILRKTVSSGSMSVLRKDLRYFGRMDTLVWFIVGGLGFYLATGAAPEADAVRAVLAFTSVLSIGTAMNFFGPDDTNGLDRYGLWPLGGGDIIGTKNRAFAVLSLVRWGPLLALACWRFGWHEAMYETVEAAALFFASMARGNVSSVSYPYAGEEGSPIFDQITGLGASAMPGLLTIGVLREGGQWTPYIMFSLLALCVAGYVFSLRWAARYYTRHFDTMHERMS